MLFLFLVMTMTWAAEGLQDSINLTDIGKRGWTAFSSQGVLCNKVSASDQILIFLDSFDPATGTNKPINSMTWTDGIPVSQDTSISYGMATFGDTSQSAIVTFQGVDPVVPKFLTRVWFYCSQCTLWTRSQMWKGISGWQDMEMNMELLYEASAQFIFINENDDGLIYLQAIAAR